VAVDAKSPLTKAGLSRVSDDRLDASQIRDPKDTQTPAQCRSIIMRILSFEADRKALLFPPIPLFRCAVAVSWRIAARPHSWFYIRILPLAAAHWRLTVGLTLAMFPAVAGCGSSDYPTASTSGIVICEGQPVAGAFVYFEPIAEGEDAYVGKGAFARTDEAGRFVLSTYGSDDGAVIGPNRVRVGAGASKCPCQTDDERDLMQYEVVAGKNEVEIVLPKADPRKRPRRTEEDDEAD
jgi:hypothetical protein